MCVSLNLYTSPLIIDINNLSEHNSEDISASILHFFTKEKEGFKVTPEEFYKGLVKN
jgi:hypothetical protein